MYRRKTFENEDEEDHQERWLLSYADLITLLFAFFVVMYATSTINLNKYRDVSKAVVSAFQGSQDTLASPATGAKPTSPTTVISPLPLAHVYAQKKLRDQEKLHALGQSLANALAPYIEQQTVFVIENRQGIHIDIQSTQLFDTNQTTLTPAGKVLLTALFKPLKWQARPMVVEGHAAVNAKASTLWQSSAMQAARVVQHLVRLGLPAKQMRAVGYADTQPKAIGETALANRLNQRITVAIPGLESEAQLAQDDSTEIILLPMTVEQILATTQASPSAKITTEAAQGPVNSLDAQVKASETPQP